MMLTNRQGELAESRRVPFTGQLPWHTGSHFRNTPEASHRIISGRNFQPSQMENIQFITPPGTVCFRPDTQQQISITFGIKHNGHLSPADILSDQQFCQGEFYRHGWCRRQWYAPHAPPRASVTSCSSGSIPCRAGFPPTGGRGRTGIQRRLMPEQFPQRGQTVFRFHFQPARQPVKSARLQIVCHLRSQRISETLGMLLGPAKSPPQKQPLTAERDLPCTHHIAGQPAQITAIPDDVHPLPETHHG